MISTPIDFGNRYCGALRRLRQQRPILAYLFDAAAISEQQMNRAIYEAHNASGQWATVGNVNVSPALHHIEQMEYHQGARDIYAGAAALVLDDILSNLFADFGEAGGVGDPGPQVGGFTTKAILKGIGNNFRHYEEWRRDEAHPTKQQIASIKAIAAVLQIPVEQNSRDICKLQGEPGVPFAHHGFYNIMARFVLHEMGDGTYPSIEALVKASMDAMVSALGLDTNTMVQIARAEWG